ncbi:hypothetical protein PENFLA_c003G09384 [Penicillium flavigenum]|uniref:Uncharacterized protein n=1 Tax=Penicillium flavigenum TaxID=254877 RepID=A0A1V6TVW1_9EURO|nr:hypothetical protein PENFLA_c003G09384 [Penicillium flavigenum]
MVTKRTCQFAGPVQVNGERYYRQFCENTSKPKTIPSLRRGTLRLRLRDGRAVQRYSREFSNIPPCALGVDISHLSAGLLMLLRAGKTGEDFRTTAWGIAHGVARPMAESEASDAGTEFTDVRSEGPEALDALPDDENSAPGTNQTRVQVGFVFEFSNTLFQTCVPASY